jgi:hypothetical protein
MKEIRFFQRRKALGGFIVSVKGIVLFLNVAAMAMNK